MKKGIFYRILGLILAVTMLFGLTGFTFLAPAGTSNTIGYTMDEPGQGDQGDQPTEPNEPTEPGKGDQGEQPTEPGQGDQGEQPTEPGQGDQGEQGTPSDIVNVTYETYEDLEVKTKNYEAEPGEYVKIFKSTGTITFVATPNAETYNDYLSVNLVAFANNKNDAITVTKNNNGSWSIVLDLTKFNNEDQIKVTAKLYGIKSMSQQGFKYDESYQEDGKWAYKREITVNTFGFDNEEHVLGIVNCVYSEKNGKLVINEEVSADEKTIVVSATGTVNEISVTATADATVSKIDRTAPSATLAYEIKKITGGKDEYHGTVTINEDDGSKIESVMYYSIIDGDISKPEHADCDPINSLIYKFNADAYQDFISNNWDDLTKSLNYYVIVTDEAGNKYDSYSSSEDGVNYHLQLKNVNWSFDTDSKYKFEGWTNKEEPEVTVNKVLNQNGSTTSTECTNIEITVDGEKVNKLSFNKVGSYVVKIKVTDGNRVISYEGTIKYDNEPAKIIDVQFLNNGEGLEGFVTKLNGNKSILFNQSFKVQITIDKDKDDILELAWGLVKKTDSGPETDNKGFVVEKWNVATADKNSSNLYTATIEKEVGFTGYLAIKVTDKAGNTTEEVWQTYKQNENGEWEKVDDYVLITNESSFSGSENVGDTGVSVSAVVEVYGKKTEWKLDENGNLIGTPVETPYTGEWVQSTTFNVKLNQSGECNADILSLSIQSVALKYGKTSVTCSGKDGYYQGSINTTYSGTVSLEVIYAVEKSVYDEDTESNTTQTDKKEVKIVLKDLTVNIDSTKDTPQAVNMGSDGSAVIAPEDWYNGNDKPLSSVTLGTRSAVPSAPATVYWELTYPTKDEQREYPNTARGTSGQDIAGLNDIFKNDENCSNELFDDYFTTPGIEYELYMFAIDAAGNISIACSLEDGVYKIPLFDVVNNNETDVDADSENKDEGNDETGGDSDAEKNPTNTTESTKTLKTTGLEYYNIWWDADAPEISAVFSKAIEQTGNVNGYYNVQRLVTITLTDYKIDLTKENGNYKYIQLQQLDKETNTYKAIDFNIVGFEEFTQKSENTYIATCTYGVESVTEVPSTKDGDYNLSITVTDLAGNVSETDSEGYLKKNGEDTETNVYEYYGTRSDDSTNNVPIFTIDQTKPDVKVEFDNNSVQNGKYYAEGRTVTFTVTENNFDKEQIDEKNPTGYNFTVNNEQIKLDWKNITDRNEKATNVWTASYDFGKDENGNTIKNFAKEFVISIEIVDKAGNHNDGVTIAEGNEDWGDFVVDSELPEIELFTDNAGTLFGKDAACRPGYVVSDAFFYDEGHSTTPTVALTRTVRDAKGEDVTSVLFTGTLTYGSYGSNDRTLQTISQLCADIAHDAENDGIYTLTVSVTDLAGNSSDRTVTFTVNRNGSFYIFNDELAEVVSNAYVKKANGHYVVTEYNASPLVPGSVSIQITRDGGKPVADFKPEIVTTGVGESGLYEYDYVIDSKYFKNDGVYKVVIYSTDEAGNKSQNLYVEKEIIKFTVDSVAPNFELIDGLQDAIVNAAEHLFSAKVYDAGNLRMVEIRIDDKIAMRFLNPDEYAKAKDNGEKNIDLLKNLNDALVEYTLLESDSKQHVVIIATDMAGNVSSTDAKDFAPEYDFNEEILVSTNFWVRYINNTWALIGTAVGIAAIAAGIWFFVKKRNSSEETAA